MMSDDILSLSTDVSDGVHSECMVLAFVAPVQVVRRRFAAALGKYYFNFSGIVAQERKLYTLSIYLQYFCKSIATTSRQTPHPANAQRMRPPLY